MIWSLPFTHLGLSLSVVKWATLKSTPFQVTRGRAATQWKNAVMLAKDALKGGGTASCAWVTDQRRCSRGPLGVKEVVDEVRAGAWALGAVISEFWPVPATLSVLSGLCYVSYLCQPQEAGHNSLTVLVCPPPWPPPPHQQAAQSPLPPSLPALCGLGPFHKNHLYLGPLWQPPEAGMSFVWMRRKLILYLSFRARTPGFRATQVGLFHCPRCAGFFFYSFSRRFPAMDSKDKFYCSFPLKQGVPHPSGFLSASQVCGPYPTGCDTLGILRDVVSESSGQVSKAPDSNFHQILSFGPLVSCCESGRK